tara:strand:+ start:408 stop:1283 length:876 start_codon:yes stop_codon:yes gene_type:complete
VIESGLQHTNSFHLAGIVPVAGEELDFNMPWHDCFMPLAKNYLAVEHAVQECAMAGCETIWIVCHKDMQPLIRERIGEWIFDPVSLHRPVNGASYEKRIAIFYVPIHPKDRYKRDCLGWSVLYGALTAYHVSNRISKWVIPDKYYAAFPYGLYPLDVVRENRDKFSSSKTYRLTHNGDSIKNNNYLGFTFDAEDFKACRRIIRKEATHARDENGDKLPLQERYSARHFSLDTVFKGAIMDGEIEVEWFHNVGSWDGYQNFLASPESKSISRPRKMKYKEWNPIGFDEVDDE